MPTNDKDEVQFECWLAIYCQICNVCFHSISFVDTFFVLHYFLFWESKFVKDKSELSWRRERKSWQKLWIGIQIKCTYHRLHWWWLLSLTMLGLVFSFISCIVSYTILLSIGIYRSIYFTHTNEVKPRARTFFSSYYTIELMVIGTSFINGHIYLLIIVVHKEQVQNTKHNQAAEKIFPLSSYIRTDERNVAM